MCLGFSSDNDPFCSDTFRQTTNRMDATMLTLDICLDKLHLGIGSLQTLTKKSQFGSKRRYNGTTSSANDVKYCTHLCNIFNNCQRKQHHPETNQTHQ